MARNLRLGCQLLSVFGEHVLLAELRHWQDGFILSLRSFNGYDVNLLMNISIKVMRSMDHVTYE